MQHYRTKGKHGTKGKSGLDFAFRSVLFPFIPYFSLQKFSFSAN
jgi:hypothetical protein